jgi:hypothetical protein
MPVYPGALPDAVFPPAGGINELVEGATADGQCSSVVRHENTLFGKFGKPAVQEEEPTRLTRPTLLHYPALMLLKTLREKAQLSEWAEWVLGNPNSAARETRDFLEVCFASIAKNRQNKVLQSIRLADEDATDSILHELVAHELLRRLRFEPDFGPKLRTNLTPDMMATVTNQQFIVDVFLSRNPSRTIRPFPIPLPGRPKFQYTVDCGDRAKKIRDRIREKHRKYARTGKPMILVVFLGDHWMSVMDVQRAVYGEPLGSEWLREEFPKAIMEFRKGLADANTTAAPPDGAMLPDELGRPGCPKVSAVLACDWFDTLNRSQPGKRMSSLVLHHWSPDVPIPAGGFGQFAEVAWTLKPSGAHGYNIIKSLNTVARFTGADELEFGDYSGSEPW